MGKAMGHSWLYNFGIVLGIAAAVFALLLVGWHAGRSAGYQEGFSDARRFHYASKFRRSSVANVSEGDA